MGTCLRLLCQQELNSTHPLQTLGLHTVHPPQACLCIQTVCLVRTHTQRFLFSGSWRDPTPTDLGSSLTLRWVPQLYCRWELQPGPGGQGWLSYYCLFEFWEVISKAYCCHHTTGNNHPYDFRAFLLFRVEHSSVSLVSLASHWTPISMGVEISSFFSLLSFQRQLVSLRLSSSADIQTCDRALFICFYRHH